MSLTGGSGFKLESRKLICRNDPSPNQQTQTLNTSSSRTSSPQTLYPQPPIGPVWALPVHVCPGPTHLFHFLPFRLSHSQNMYAVAGAKLWLKVPKNVTNCCRHSYCCTKLSLESHCTKNIHFRGVVSRIQSPATLKALHLDISTPTTSTAAVNLMLTKILGFNTVPNKLAPRTIWRTFHHAPCLRAVGKDISGLFFSSPDRPNCLSGL